MKHLNHWPIEVTGNKSFLLVMALVIFVVTSAFALEPQWVIDLHEAHTNNGMAYRLLRPLNFDPGRLYPVIVSMHSYPGVGTDNKSNIRQWNSQLATNLQLRVDYPAYVVVPQTTNTWKSYYYNTIKNVIANDLTNVDMGRIYILGQSYGGYGTWMFIDWTGPGYFAAAAPVSGGNQPTTTANVKDIPIWAFHGDGDTTVKYSFDSNFFALMNGVGNEKFTMFVGVGHSTDDKFIPYVDNTGMYGGSTQFSDATNSVKVCDHEPVFMKWLFTKRLPGWYPLTVNSGNGSGSYTNGRQVAISAKTLYGQTFVQWVGDTQYVSSATASPATVTMPATAVTLTATYAILPGWYSLSVLGGTGGGIYTNGTVVPIMASNAPAGQAFDHWTGDTQFVGSVTAATTTATLSGQNVSLAATYKNVHALAVNGGTGSGTYDNGQQVAISVNPGRTFVRWIGDTQYVSSTTNSPATVTMPASGTNGVTLTAIYSDVILMVLSGTGSGTYTNGQTVAISGSDIRTGVSLNGWIGTGAPYVTSNTTVVMPPQDIALTATYNYNLTVNYGSGSGMYTNGQSVRVVASNAPAGKSFFQWGGDTQYLDDPTSPDAQITLATNPVTLTPTYVGSVPATIALVNSTGGETSSSSTTISKIFPTTGGNVLVVNLSYKGVNGTYPAGPPSLNWVTSSGTVTQAMTLAVQAGNNAAKAFGSSIYYLWNPIADAGGTISGSLPTGYANQVISAFTLSGVDTITDPLIGSATNDATSSSSITTTPVAGVSAGGFAALCSGSAANISSNGFSASASGGTPVNRFVNNVGGGDFYQGYIPNLVTTTTNFTCAHGSAARLHIVAAVFTPGFIITNNGNLAPVFPVKPISRPSGRAGVSYSSTLAGLAYDLDAGDTLTYSKVINVTSNTWLNVASDGTLYGTPGASDVGTNVFTVQVTDAALAFDTATLKIVVTQPLPPLLSATITNNNHQLWLQFTGVANGNYILQSASNLTPPIDWQPVLTNPADANGVWQFTDTNLNSGLKFYRVLSP